MNDLTDEGPNELRLREDRRLAGEVGQPAEWSLIAHMTECTTPGIGLRANPTTPPRSEDGGTSMVLRQGGAAVRRRTLQGNSPMVMARMPEKPSQPENAGGGNRDRIGQPVYSRGPSRIAGQPLADRPRRRAAVALAQPAEHWIVAPEVTGSKPVGHPNILWP
jgi:hypothetical protein